MTRHGEPSFRSALGPPGAEQYVVADGAPAVGRRTGDVSAAEQSSSHTARLTS
ncbi:hypothetical protein [Streptomyces sp. NPDC053755]|uniref:hypothetical protein n=1 Tax=Streptomyces sp. NPDC053755 TaxID=3155815 RepID=UPI003443B8E1